jgi:hypothetical protein
VKDKMNMTLKFFDICEGKGHAKFGILVPYLSSFKDRLKLNMRRRRDIQKHMILRITFRPLLILIIP